MSILKDIKDLNESCWLEQAIALKYNGESDEITIFHKVQRFTLSQLRDNDVKGPLMFK